MRPLNAVVGAIGVTVMLAGCGGAIPSSNGGPAMLKVQHSSGGTFLVDGHGHTLYLFDKDEKGESYCSGACAAVWPPFETSSTPQPSSGVDGAALGTMKRDDGDTQVTFHGHPLYYYAADASTPGRTKGEDVNQFGASWYLVAPSGQALEPESHGGSKSQPSSGSKSEPSSGSKSGGGGWG
jgi:predicted lipoprotein with Yx(FWY)xxD motif